MASFRYDDIGISLAWSDKLKVHRLYRLGISVDNPLHVLATLNDIPGDYSHQSVIIVSVNKNLYIHLVAQLLAGEDKNTFDYDYVSRLDVNCLRLSGAGKIRIRRLFYRLPLFEILQLRYKQLPVYGIRMVEIQSLTLFHRKMALVLVIGNLISQKARVKNEIKSNGGYITTGECVIVGSGKNSHAEVIFTDAMGNPRSEKINKDYGQKIIIAHSTFNDIDIICLDKEPSEAILAEYGNGKFIGPCSKIDLSNTQEDEQTRAKYTKLYTIKED